MEILGGKHTSKGKSVRRRNPYDLVGFRDFLLVFIFAVMIAFGLAMIMAWRQEPWNTVAWTLIMLAIAIVVVLIVILQKRITKQ